MHIHFPILLNSVSVAYHFQLWRNLVKPFQIFFLIGKDNSLRAKRLEKGYTRSIPRYKEAKNKKINKPDPYLVASQSTKSIKERVCSSMYTIAQFTKAYKEMDLISWLFLSISSKALLFLSFQMVHIRQRGAALQAFSLFLPTKDPCHPRRFLFTGVHHPLHPKKGEDQKP